jgi:hypothetical protein
MHTDMQDDCRNECECDSRMHGEQQVRIAHMGWPDRRQGEPECDAAIAEIGNACPAGQRHDHRQAIERPVIAVSSEARVPPSEQPGCEPVAQSQEGRPEDDSTASLVDDEEQVRGCPVIRLLHQHAGRDEKHDQRGNDPMEPDRHGQVAQRAA